MVSKQNAKISKQVTAKLMVESRETCNRCWESKEVQIHHIIPISQGGDNSEDNLILLCLRCHSQVHTKKMMAQNLSRETLKLYKESWLDLVRIFPLIPDNIREEDNDVKIVTGILKQADRRAMYYPPRFERTRSMFQSLDDFRIYMQSCGRKLIINKTAREHVNQVYKCLLEILLLQPRDIEEERYCLLSALGRRDLMILELRRSTIMFHLNELAELLGYEKLFSINEFHCLGSDILETAKSSPRPGCYAKYSKSNPECRRCEFINECRQETI